jgi:hypothetical protein
MPRTRSLSSLISRSMKDIPDAMEIWRRKWLECLERANDMFPWGTALKVRIGCMKNFGSLEDILMMIEEGDQGTPLRTRVDAIRQDANLMQTLRSLWEDEDLTMLMNNWLQ